MKELIQKYLPSEYKIIESSVPRIEAHFIVETVKSIYNISLDLTPDPEQSAEIIAEELVKTMWEVEPPAPRDKKEIN